MKTMMGEKGSVCGKYRVHPGNGQGMREEPETESGSGRVFERQIPKNSYLDPEGSKNRGVL